MPELFKEILKFSNVKDEFKILPNLYQVELKETKEELIESLYNLKEKLHPQLLFSEGRRGTLNGINWLIEHKDDFKKAENREAYARFRYRLQELSNSFAEMLFGEFADQPFESELVYSITSSTFKRMGIGSHVKNENERELELDLSVLGKGKVDYKFVLWEDKIEKRSGKILDEYYLDDKLKVEIGLKPSVFRFLSTGVTTPTHEIVHHICELYTSGAYASAISKSFNESFKDIKLFRVFQDKGILFGSIDNRIKDKLKSFDLREKDLTDPFVFLEIIKRHGIKISDISGISLHKLYNASFNYLSNYLPFRILEEGVASYLSIENACIEKAPKEFAGLENSLKELVRFGARLRKLEYLERGMSFYTGERPFASYPIPELQVYPLGYLYLAQKVEEHKPANIRWYFELLRTSYLKKNIRPERKFIRKKRLEEVSPELERQRRLQALIGEMNQNIQNYRKRLDEIDRLLKEYRNQLDRIRPLENASYSIPSGTNQLNRLLENSRIRNFISENVRNNEILKGAMYIAAGTLFIFALTKALDNYLG